MAKIPATLNSSGILAIWNTCAAGQQADYEAWYQTEHLYERLSVAGFRRGRRYEAVEGCARFFTYYETDSPAVLTSSAYLQCVDNPTPATRLIMRNAFTNMTRTVCQQQFVLGEMRGGFAATIQLAQLPDVAVLSDWLNSNSRSTSIARIEGWQAVTDVAPESTEARIRGGDNQINACLFLEALRVSDCHLALEDLTRDLNLSEPHAGFYRLLCELAS